MTRLIRKDVKFEWTGDCEKPFKELKGRLTKAPVLIVPSGSAGFAVYCDALGKGLGAMLMH